MKRIMLISILMLLVVQSAFALKIGGALGDAIDRGTDSIGDAGRDVGNGINDTADDVGDALRDTRDSVSTGATNFWNYLNKARIDLGATCTDDEGKSHSVNAGTDCGKWLKKRRESEGGFGEEEITLQLGDIYRPEMSNKKLTLEQIEGRGQVFSWVPIINQISYFIPVYSSGIPAMPTDQDIWNNTDSDGDGIYDDMEYFIAKNFPNNDELRLASYRYVHSLKQLVDNIDDNNRFISAMINIGMATDCLKVASQAQKIALFIAASSTLERMKAVWKMGYVEGDLLINLNRTNSLRCL